MADKIRVYELAKENGLESKEMIKILNDEFNLGIKSHMSMISGEDRKLINEFLSELNDDSSDEVSEEEIKSLKQNQKLSKRKKEKRKLIQKSRR